MIRYESPIEYLKKYGNTEIFLKRDDKIPFSYGGNKVRMAAEVFSEIKKGCFDTVISYGPQSSNMNRAIADMANKHGIGCYVIMKRVDMDDFHGEFMNEKLVRESQAQIVYCDAKSVRQTVEKLLELIRDSGGKPYYIYGNSLGHGNEKVLMRPFLDESDEIVTWEKENNIWFDHIFLAVGTSLTMSGLIVGMSHAMRGLDEQMCHATSDPDEEIGLATGDMKIKSANTSHRPIIHGISTSRTVDIVNSVIKDNIDRFYGDSKDSTEVCAKNTAISQGMLPGYDITDSYIYGGYGSISKGELDVILEISRDYDIALDPVYTGKAFWGMLAEIRKRDLGGNCLFIHTGGYPLYEDARRLIQPSPSQRERHPGLRRPERDR